MDDFERELKQGFLEEASQLLAEAEQCFLTLENSRENPELLEQIFRLAHNLKGSARAVGFGDLSHFTHQLESLLLKIREGKIGIHAATVNLLLRCNDHVLGMIDGLKANFDAQFDSVGLLEELKGAIEGNLEAAAEAPPVPASSSGTMEAQSPGISEIEIPAEILNFSNSEYPSADAFAVEEPTSEIPTPVTPVEMSPALEGRPHLVPVPDIKDKPTPNSKESKAAPVADESIRVSLSRLEKLLNFVGEMVILQTVLKEQVSGNPLLLRKTIHQIGKVTKELQEISMNLRMLPLKPVFQKMQRIVRDTSLSLSKKINLVIEGEETEIDKTVFEKIGDPLVHLVRNAVDHGVETPEVRLKNGKSETGTVFLRAFHQGGTLIIEVEDNGGGIDADRLRAKAVEKGVLKKGAVISDEQAYQLIFHSGFSTKAQVTDVSGRGVGMDVVKTNIEALQGEVEVETKLGKGSLFRVRLPLTLAIVDGMITRSGEERYIIPLSHVQESLRLSSSDVHFVSGMGEILRLRGENLPLFRLEDLLGTNKKGPKPVTDYTAVVVRSHGKMFAVAVDTIIGQHQIVIKQLGKEHMNLKVFTGSAILGDGRPALILELGELISLYGSKGRKVVPPPQQIRKELA